MSWSSTSGQTHASRVPMLLLLRRRNSVGARTHSQTCASFDSAYHDAAAHLSQIPPRPRQIPRRAIFCRGGRPRHSFALLKVRLLVPRPKLGRCERIDDGRKGQRQRETVARRLAWRTRSTTAVRVSYPREAYLCRQQNVVTAAAAPAPDANATLAFLHLDPIPPKRRPHGTPQPACPPHFPDKFLWDCAAHRYARHEARHVSELHRPRRGDDLRCRCTCDLRRCRIYYHHFRGRKIRLGTGWCNGGLSRGLEKDGQAVYSGMLGLGNIIPRVAATRPRRRGDRRRDDRRITRWSDEEVARKSTRKPTERTIKSKQPELEDFHSKRQQVHASNREPRQLDHNTFMGKHDQRSEGKYSQIFWFHESLPSGSSVAEAATQAKATATAT